MYRNIVGSTEISLYHGENMASVKRTHLLFGMVVGKDGGNWVLSSFWLAPTMIYVVAEEVVAWLIVSAWKYAIELGC